jgi:uncharacterized protein DUF6754
MRRFFPALFLLLLLAGSAAAQDALAPPTEAIVEDYDLDWGGQTLKVLWRSSPAEEEEGFTYRIYRSESADGPWERLADVKMEPQEYLDTGAGDKAWFYRVTALLRGQESEGAVTAGSAVGVPNRFKLGRYNSVLFVFVFTALILGWIWTAGRKVPGGFLLGFFGFGGVFTVVLLLTDLTPIWNSPMSKILAFIPLVLPSLALIIPLLKSKGDIYVRPIPAIGRATEMGKPILFVPGISTIEDVATLAALNILSPVAEKAAQYDSKLIVPNYDPIVFTVTQEVVKEAYLKAGRPDAYSDDNVFYLSARQFAYAAAVNGMMVREKPATNFFLGMFYAESLLLAETGNMTGAIQIAGTDAVTQLPFFIVACDYTLIGEELYAAGAYMGGDPKLTGGLKGQDWNKALGIFFMVVLTGWFVIQGIFSDPTTWPDWIRNLPSTLFEVGK